MLILFTISGILLILLFCLRLIEIKIGKKTILSKMTSKTDVFFYFCVRYVDEMYKKLKFSFNRLFTHHVPSHSEKMWDVVRRFAQAKQNKARDALRGRKIFKDGGNVSFFLKNISDARRKNNEGRTIIG